MNLVNLWYKYRNRFLNSNELLEQLEALDLSTYKKSEIYEIKKLVEDIKKETRRGYQIYQRNDRE